MTVEEKIRTMIGQLEVALEEIEYGREYFKKEKKMKVEAKEFDRENANYVEDEFYQQNHFGHTGFTGTFFFINPDNNRFLIVLTNRVNPSRTNRLMYKDDFCPKIWKEINN